MWSKATKNGFLLQTAFVVLYNTCVCNVNHTTILYFNFCFLLETKSKGKMINRKFNLLPVFLTHS